MPTGDQAVAAEIKREYDHVFDQVTQLEALRDTWLDQLRPVAALCTQIAHLQSRLRHLDERLFMICRLPQVQIDPADSPLHAGHPEQGLRSRTAPKVPKGKWNERTYTDEQLDHCKQLAIAGKTLKQIVAETQVPYNIAMKWKRKLNPTWGKSRSK